MKQVITYETPELTVFEIHSEGALCQSYNDYGLRNLKDDDVTDESGDWN